MLNPSTADGSGDDPTIRRCTTCARSWGCGGLTIVNLFGWRATRPADLASADHDNNDQAIQNAVTTAAQQGWPLIAAWGLTPCRPGPVTFVRLTELAGCSGVPRFERNGRALP